jgi:putative transcriptional regulator
MIQPASGVLLISDPFLKDPNFMRTVVLLCEHNSDGSFGLVLNRRIPETLGDLIKGLEQCKIPVHYGGPVQMDTLHYVHQLPHQIEGGDEICEGVYWGGNFETIIRLIQEEQLDEKRIRFFLGYSGWGSGQLAAEMEEKSWLTVAANARLIFQTPEKEIWKQALHELGGEYGSVA